MSPQKAPLVVEQCCSLGCNCWFEFGNSSYESVLVLPLSLTKGVHGRVVDGVLDVILSLVSTAFGAVPKGFFDGVGKVLTQIWD